MHQHEKALRDILERINRTKIKDFQAAVLLLQIADDATQALSSQEPKVEVPPPNAKL